MDRASSLTRSLSRRDQFAIGASALLSILIVGLLVDTYAMKRRAELLARTGAVAPAAASSRVGLEARAPELKPRGGSARAAVAAPAAGAGSATSPARRLASFLQRVRPLYDGAQKACDAAQQCAFVWAPDAARARGQITDIARVPACLQTRIPTCSTALDELVRFSSAGALEEDLWRGYVRNSVTANLLHAQVTRDMLNSMSTLPRLKIKGKLNKEWVSLEKWAYEHSPEYAERYQAIADEIDADMEASVALEHWIGKLGMCLPGHECSIEKVMHGRGLKPEYLHAAPPH